MILRESMRYTSDVIHNIFGESVHIHSCFRGDLMWCDGDATPFGKYQEVQIHRIANRVIMNILLTFLKCI